MELQLKNIGMIKEANVKLDGLTVIAGENDTGKSTVGKALFATILADRNVNRHSQNFWQDRTNLFIQNINLLFNNQLARYFTNDSKIKLSTDNKNFYEITYANSLVGYGHNSLSNIDSPPFLDCAFVQTPLIFDFFDFFNSINFAKSQSEIFNQNLQISYPFIMWDLYGKLSHPRQYSSQGMQSSFNIKNIISGEFKRDSIGRYYYSRINNTGYEEVYNLSNVATGIKSFGIIQALLNNNYLSTSDLLILDEPEVHLHPKWQLKMAELIVHLVKNGVKILVNSHSPYMIQALIKYARDKDITDNSNFYLVTKKEDYSIFENVSDDLNKIFELLSEPMNEVFEL